MSGIDLAGLRAWVGRSSTAEDVVTPRQVALFSATLAPNLAPVAQDEAPLALHWCVAPPDAPMDELGQDGHPAKGGFLPPVPLPRRMWAGGEIEFFAPLPVGAAVTRRSVVSDVRLKEGRTGPLCFVTVEHEVRAGAALVVRDRQDIVYREPDPHPSSAAGAIGGPSAQAPPSAPDTGLTWHVETPPTLLFRYSALTFNAHRIHYDQPYAHEVEGYPGLVVHGPLQATLLLNCAATLAGRRPAKFSYRGVSALIAGPAFAVTAQAKPGGGVDCRAISAQGQVTMQAAASW